MPYLKFIFILLGIFAPFCASFAMPPGTLLYRTTDKGKMFGYSGHPLIDFWNGIATGINPGHVGIYVGEENGRSYIVEALAGGVVKTPLENFVNEAAGEKLIGAKIPKNLTPLQQLKVVDLAKRLADSDLEYDFDFKKQKGPGSGEWTCVGLSEKIYESANTPNPLDISYLEYDAGKYAVNITPDGFDDYSFYNKEGDCFSKEKEFSLIARRTDTILPLPEEKGFNAGLIYKGERYIFFPYTQFLQKTLDDVVVDKKVSSSFKSSDIRGKTNIAKVLLRWSLINNPVSAVKVALFEAQEKISALFSGSKDEILLAAGESAASNDSMAVENASSQSPVSSKIFGAKITLNTNPESSSISASAQTNDSKNKKSNISEVEDEFLEESGKTNNPKQLSTQEQEISLSSAPLAAVSEQAALQALFISKLYSTDKNDFIELYNPNSVPIDLAEHNYRLEKTKTAKDPSLIMRIGNSADGIYPGGTIISAHGYYLIVRDDAASYYKNLASAVATRSEFDFSGNGQSIYLGVGAISSYEDEDIVDAIGCGPAAIYFRGTRPALKIDDYHFLNRIAYTNNNDVDFNLLLSSEPAAIEAWRLEKLKELSAVVEDNNTPNVSNSNNTNSPITATTSQSTTTTASATTSTTTNANTADSLATTTPIISEEAWQEAYKQILIEKVSSDAYNDFIALHNYSMLDVDLALAGFRLEKTKSSIDPGILMRVGNTEDGSYPGGTLLKAGESYLIVRDDADAYFLNQADAIASRKDFNLFSSGYSIYLGLSAISGPDDEDIIDLLGYGSDSLFYDGLSPAPKIEEGNYLKRIGRTNNNNADFVNFLDENLSSSNTPPINGDFGLFTPIVPQESEGIMDLWHFDDCHGDYGGVPAIGKWDCGRKIGLNFGSASFDLAQDVSLENFSVAFYFNPSDEKQFAGFVLNGPNNNSVSLRYEKGVIIVSGLPGGNFFYPDNEFTPAWHQMIVTINQSEDYYAIYVDGKEIIKVFFLARLPKMSSLDISDGGNAMIIDEVAVWPRALEPDEVVDIFKADKPFAPCVFSMPPQKGAELKYSWSFEEDMGTSAADSVVGEAIAIPENFWTARAHNNYAVNLYYPGFYTKLGSSNSFIDFSMTFWWKDTAYPYQGRSLMYLYDDSGDKQTTIFALSLDVYNRLVFMNGSWHLISQSLTDVLPDDGKWHHIAATYDSYRQVFRLFVDGVMKLDTRIVRFKEGYEKFNSIKFIPESGSVAIDEFRLYSGALSSAEVKSLYESSKTE